MIELPMYVVVICVAMLYLIIPTLLIAFCKNTSTLKIITIILAIIFFACLYICITFKVSYTTGSVKILFKYSGEWANKTIAWNALKFGLKDMAINLAMLFPMGAIINVFSNKNFAHTLLLSAVVGVCLGVCLEGLQYVLPVARSVQLSDVIFNTCSVVIGTIYFYIIKKLSNNNKKITSV